MSARPFASRPLTFISPGMLAHARDLRAEVVAARSRCGRYWTFQVVSVGHTEPDLVVVRGDDVPALERQHGGLISLGENAVAAFLASRQ